MTQGACSLTRLGSRAPFFCLFLWGLRLSRVGNLRTLIIDAVRQTLILTATHIGDAEMVPLSETLMDNDMLLSLNLRWVFVVVCCCCCCCCC